MFQADNEMFDDTELSCDGFLGGRLKVFQPRNGYRAATDPVFLAASVRAKPGDTVLELGCGAGVASLCLKARVDLLDVTGVEIQPAYADLARRNAAANNLPFEIVTADLTELPQSVLQASFDHVIANPPYLARGAGTPAGDAGREAAFREETPLATWITVAMRRVKPKGYATFIHLAERLPDLLGAVGSGAGSIEVKPLAARENRPANRVLVRVRKSGREAMKLHAPLVIHSGAVHDGDRDDFTKTVSNILRHGGALEF